MEILPCEEVERAVDAKMQLLQDGPIYIKKAVYYHTDVATHCGFSENSSDEDDYKTSLPVASEESSVCCVCGDSIPILSKLIEHFKTHTAEVHCHLCRTKFGRVMSLALHLKNAHSTHSLLCEICGSFFSCTWHLNGHIGKHQKDKMEAKPVVKIEPREEINISETVSYSDVRTTIKDHSYFNFKQPPTKNPCDAIQKCTDNDTTSTNQALHIKTETVILPFITDKQNSISCSSFPKSQLEPEHLSFGVKEENDFQIGLEVTEVQEVAAELEIRHTEDDKSCDTDDGNPDSLPPGDSAYKPDEDISSDDEYNESLQKGKRRKQQSPDKKKSTNSNLVSTIIAEKFGFQSDSPFCCYGKFANLGKHMDDCNNKMTFTCSVCSLACESKEVLQKHTDEKHPVAGYICAFCRNIFPGQENFKKHVCWKRLLSKTNLEATPVTELPVVRLSNSSGQGAPSAPVGTSQNTIKVIKITQTVNKSPTASNSPNAVTSPGLTKGVTVHQLLQTGSAKVTKSAPQTSSCVIRPNVPIHTPLVMRPLLSNPTRIPSTSKPTLPTQVVVSFSPTTSVSTPAVVSASKPILRPTSVASIRPIPVNVPMITPLTGPTLRFPTPSNPPLPTQVNVSFSPTVNIRENKETLQKNAANNHHLAGYICTVCRNVFTSQDNIKNHVCWKKPRPVTGPTLRIPANPTQVNVSYSPTVNGFTPTLLSTNKSVLSQASAANITPVPIHMPLITSVSCPTLRIPTPSNPAFPSQVTVSFSPTVNISSSSLVSANKPVLRQMSAANIVPVNVPLITSVTCPTLVNALTGSNQPQGPPVQVPSVQPPLQVVGMFVNHSRGLTLQKGLEQRDLSLQKGLEQSWRSKTIFPCRHCGAVSRQPSLRVRHRYLHRGSRLYRCQCGRAFQRRMHLLRHQVQHAESVRFVCTWCGNTFKGANKLTWHKQKRKNVRRCAKKTCKAAFDCSCGQMFARPSALLWHMLKNSKRLKHTKKLSMLKCK